MRRRTHAQWRALITEHKASGMTAVAFCEAQGLCPKYFGRKRKQWQDKDAKNTASSFVPVLVAGSGPGMIEACLDEALRLHIPTTVSTHWLAELLRQLRS